MNSCWWVLTTRSFSVESRLGRTSVWSVSLGKKTEKEKEESATRISPRELKHNCKTTTSSSKFSPAVPPNQNAQKTRSGKTKCQKPNENSLPKITSTKHPQQRQTHPKPQKRKKKKKHRQRTKHTQQTSYCFSLEFLLKSKPQREEKTTKDKPKTHTETEQVLQLGGP
jgi:hypothetical protein